MRKPVPCKSKDVVLIAANCLESWLGAAGIPVTRNPVAESSAGDMVIIGDLLVGLGVEGDITLAPENIASMFPELVEPELRRLTDALGVPPLRVLRGERERSRDPFLRALRISEYRLSPDLSRDLVDRYRSVSDVMIRRYRRMNEHHLERRGLSYEDLQAAATIWAANFHHRWRRPSVERTLWNFAHYVKQRLMALSRLSKRAVGELVTLHFDGPEGMRETTPDSIADGVEPLSGDLRSSVQDLEIQLVDLRDRLSYLPRRDLERRLVAVVARDPSLERAALSLMRRMGTEMSRSENSIVSPG